MSKEMEQVAADGCESPRMQARRQAFLEAAAEAFAEKGYAAATLDDVIARSGGSRQTLYAMFGGKQGLFAALLAEKCRRIFGGMTMEQVLAQPVDEALTGIGVRFLSVVTSREGIAVQRLVMAEAHRIPEVVDTFWKQGPGRNRMLLGRYLALQAERGVLRIPDPQIAAGTFWGMLQGPFQMELLLGLREPPTDAEIETVVDDVVARFLSGCLVESHRH